MGSGLVLCLGKLGRGSAKFVLRGKEVVVVQDVQGDRTGKSLLSLPR